MADRQDENEPLLNNQSQDEAYQEEVAIPITPSIPNIHSSELGPPPTEPPPFDEVSPPPPIMPGEEPPPYTDGPTGAVPMINCRVCQAMISLEGKLHQHVVKCAICHEATPIKEAPQGKKYVRCPCNCLLICKASSKRIACPRSNCKRIINLQSLAYPHGPPSTTNTLTTISGFRIVCAHCNQWFRFPHHYALARCPYCRKVSSVGPNYAKNRCCIYAVLGIIFLAAGIGVTVATLHLAQQQGGIYFVWIGAFVVAILNFMRSCYYGSMKVSSIENE